jgi:hypothetical protein
MSEKEVPEDNPMLREQTIRKTDLETPEPEEDTLILTGDENLNNTLEQTGAPTEDRILTKPAGHDSTQDAIPDIQAALRKRRERSQTKPIAPINPDA